MTATRNLFLIVAVLMLAAACIFCPNWQDDRCEADRQDRFSCDRCGNVWYCPGTTGKYYAVMDDMCYCIDDQGSWDTGECGILENYE